MGMLSGMLIFNFAQAPTRPVRPTGKELSCGRFSTFFPLAPSPLARSMISPIQSTPKTEQGREHVHLTSALRGRRFKSPILRGNISDRLREMQTIGRGSTMQAVLRTSYVHGPGGGKWHQRGGREGGRPEGVNKTMGRLSGY